LEGDKRWGGWKPLSGFVRCLSLQSRERDFYFAFLVDSRLRRSDLSLNEAGDRGTEPTFPRSLPLQPGSSLDIEDLISIHEISISEIPESQLSRNLSIRLAEHHPLANFLPPGH